MDQLTSQARLARRPGFLVRRLHQIYVSMYMEGCERFGTTPVQSSVMQVLLVRPGMDQAALAAEIGLDRTTISDVLTRLVERGILRREVDGRDRRSKRAFLTPEGESLVREMQGAIDDAHRQLIEPLDEPDRGRFVSLLFQLVEANNARGRTTLSSL